MKSFIFELISPQFAVALRRDLTESLSHYLNDLALEALYFDPCFKAMNQPRFSPEEKGRAERLFRANFPEAALAFPAPDAMDVDAEYDAPVGNSVLLEGNLLSFSTNCI